LSYIVKVNKKASHISCAILWCVENIDRRLWRSRSSEEDYHLLPETGTYWSNDVLKWNDEPIFHSLRFDFDAIGFFAFYRKEDAIQFKMIWG